MPEYKKTADGDWIPRRNWSTVCAELQELRGNGADWRAFRVRSSLQEGDEARADAHPETAAVFRPPADASLPLPGQGPAGEPTTPARQPRPVPRSRTASGIEAFRDDIEEANTRADYRQANAERHRWIPEWLDSGADPGERGPGGWTPLHFAAAGNWPAALSTALLDAGAGPNDRNEAGSTPLHLAARYASPDVVRALLAGGALVGETDATGLTPLHLAARDAGREIIDALVEAGAEVDARAPKAMTPLHLAATSGTEEAVTALCQAEADVDARNEDGWAPLHAAASHDRPRAVAAELLRADADVNARTQAGGWTPLQMAAAKSGHEFVSTLLVAGADVHATNDDGSTALELAKHYQKTNQVALLLRRAARAESGQDAKRAWSGEGPARSRWSAGKRGPSSTPARPTSASQPRPAGAESRTGSRVWPLAFAFAVLAGFAYFITSFFAPGSTPGGGPTWQAPTGDSAPSVPGSNTTAPSAAGPGASAVVPPDTDTSTPPNAVAEVHEGSSAPTAPTVDVPAPASVERRLGLDRAARRRVQAALSAAGFDPNGVDGVFGDGTRDAIRDWQQAQGLAITGYLDRQAAERLSAFAARAGLESGRPAPRRTAGDVRGAAGRLTVRGDPSSTIELDGTAVGVVPPSGAAVVVPDVPPGEHFVSARREGYLPVTRVVEVTGDRAAVVDVTTEGMPGRLTASADIPGAVLRIGSAEARPLPVTNLEIPVGAHDLLVDREGYRPIADRVDVRPGQLVSRDFILEAIPHEERVRAALAPAEAHFRARDYRAAVDALRSVLDVVGDSPRANWMLGAGLYELGEFPESVTPLARAIALGAEVVLPAKHRHGGGGFREGFCEGTLTLSLGEIAFASFDAPDHGFAVAPDKVAQPTITGSVAGFPFRLNTSVRDPERGIERNNFDFVHRNAARQAAPEESLRLIVLGCPDCDGSLHVQQTLMRTLIRAANQ